MPNFTSIPSTSEVLSVYASVATSTMLIRTMANQFIPHQFQNYIFSRLQNIFTYFISSTRLLTIVIDEFTDLDRNQIFEASEIYLRSKLTTYSSSMNRIKATKTPRDKKLLLRLEKDQEIIDFFHGIQLKWKLVYHEDKKSSDDDDDCRWFELIFDKKHKGIILDSYLPHIVEESKALKEENKVLRLHNRGQSINLEHPTTFDKLAMDPELKRVLIEDLDRFVKRREFYRRVGKAWKRGYLLYGPPGTGKSSLIAAMANYLKFDIYDVELTSLRSNSDLRSLMLKTANRSILVIEDIDCSIEMEDRGNKGATSSNQLTLSGLLNFIDGLWSSCGDERIIVFTTNYKDRLDPALLRPGRMDMHIHMSYCTPSGFKLLASNYLGICDHPLFEEIERLIEKAKVTPAEVAEELMKSDDVEVTLNGLINFIHRKKNTEQDRVKPRLKVIDDGERVDGNEVLAELRNIVSPSREFSKLSPIVDLLGSDLDEPRMVNPQPSGNAQVSLSHQSTHSAQPTPEDRERDASLSSDEDESSEDVEGLTGSSAKGPNPVEGSVGAMESIVSDSELEELLVSYGISDTIRLRAPRPREMACFIRADKVALYEIAFKYGFCFPVLRLVDEILDHWHLSSSKLTLNAWLLDAARMKAELMEENKKKAAEKAKRKTSANKPKGNLVGLSQKDVVIGIEANLPKASLFPGDKTLQSEAHAQEWLGVARHSVNWTFLTDLSNAKLSGSLFQVMAIDFSKATEVAFHFSQRSVDNTLLEELAEKVGEATKKAIREHQEEGKRKKAESALEAARAELKTLKESYLQSEDFQEVLHQLSKPTYASGFSDNRAKVLNELRELHPNLDLSQFNEDAATVVETTEAKDGVEVEKTLHPSKNNTTISVQLTHWANGTCVPNPLLKLDAQSDKTERGTDPPSHAKFGSNRLGKLMYQPNMMDFTTIPSTSKVLSVYASVTTAIMLIRTMANQLIPHQYQAYIFSRLQNIFAHLITSPRTPMTFIVDEYTGLHRNQVFDASEIYLRSKLILPDSSSMDRVKVAKTPRDKNILLGFEKDQEIIDFFHEIQLKWKLVYQEDKNSSSPVHFNGKESRSFELIFDKKHKGTVLGSYLPHVVEESKALKEENKVLKLYNRGQSVNLEHPATFDKLAMDLELKRGLIEDLDRFVKRKEFYKRVGKAWKRGYLLYGPPGTGKSSLIAAMANYLNFDIYDLELAGLRSNSELRGLLVSTTNRSILVIEDIDCSIETEDRGNRGGRSSDDQVSC
ncbi:uncharacterized protein LOC122644765 [Telopea speciosissima]|uniref:uncharacterized protein LOC122644765 n=1 Tax=Telopea speciosissima TaxID=54955 RepID=UPI001CC4996C|nr:uncharacterized protein LOC122644765 [Telopea speciosissima]